ncbi:MAG: exosortase/archaeosortase family protein [Anaerolineae bacterium]
MPLRWETLRPAVVITTVIGLVGLLFYPTLRWLVMSWLGNPYYSHGFLIPLVAAFFTWHRRHVFRQRRPSNLGFLVILIGIGLHLLALPWRMHVVSALALIVIAFGLVLTFFGRPAARALSFPLAFSGTAIPLPWVERFSPSLEAFVARYATLGVRTIGVAASNVGSQVQIASQSFKVGAPCSGLRSIVVLLTLTVLFIYITRGPWWGKLMLLVAALPIALAANLLRVSSLFWVADTFGADAGLRYYHTFSSPVLFLAAFGLLIASGRVLQCAELRSDLYE